MTSGSVNIKNFPWALKTKKRHRSGSGGSKDHEAKKKSFLSRRQNTGNAGSRRNSSATAAVSSPSLEVVAPITSDIEFKFTWPIDGFLRLVKKDSLPLMNGEEKTSTDEINNDGLDSQPFDVHINGVQTSWTMSIRFWTGENGERLANPFVLCLNLRSCKVAKPVDVGVKFKFGVLNRGNNEYEMGAPDNKADVHLETGDELRSIGYKNIAINEKHVNSKGDIQLVCKLKIVKDDSTNHSLSSDLRSLINDEKSSDLVLEAGGKTFKVHRNILSARSPVFADILEQSKDMDKLEIKDLQAETLEELLTYIYTDSSVNVDVFANALLAAADSYMLPGLKTHCAKHLGEIMRPDNVASVLMLADKYRCTSLKKSALGYCKDNHNYIMKDDHWKTIEEENPVLFEEAVAEVVNKEECNSHSECVKKGGKRYEIEKASSVVVSAKELYKRSEIKTRKQKPDNKSKSTEE